MGLLLPLSLMGRRSSLTFFFWMDRLLRRSTIPTFQSMSPLHSMATGFLSCNEDV